MAPVIDQLNLQVALRDKYFAKIQRLFNFANNARLNDLDEFAVRCEQLDVIRDSFETAIDNINFLNAKVEKDDKIDLGQCDINFEDLYIKIKVKLRSLMESKAKTERLASPGSSQSTVVDKNEVKLNLPHLQIPTFSGKISEWENFSHLFEATFHRNSHLSGITKFQYLLSLLKGPALALVSALEITEANYEVAYQILTKRFQSSRLLAQYHLDRLFTFKPLTSDSLSNLTLYLETFNNSYESLKNLHIADLDQFILCYVALKALDSETRQNFEIKYCEDANPSYDKLISFIQNKCRVQELIGASNTKGKIQEKTKGSPATSLPSRKVLLAQENSEKTSVCSFCQEPHAIYSCKKFIMLAMDERIKFVKTAKLCFACLGNHMIKNCKSTSSCRICNKNSHHSLLHFNRNSTSDTPRPSSPSTPLQANSALGAASDSKIVLLGTALINIFDHSGHPFTARAIIDTGSQLSFISEKLADRLKLPVSKVSLAMSGIGNYPVSHDNNRVECTIANTSRNFIRKIQPLVLKQICAEIPSLPVGKDTLKKFSHLNLADKDLVTPSPIDFLIGSDLYQYIVTPTAPLVTPDQPVAINTVFGWILIGSASIENPQPRNTALLVNLPALNNTLKEFWALEEVSVDIPGDPEDEMCEAHFINTHFRDPDGRYVVALPFKNKPLELGDNRGLARKQYLSLEKRLARQPELQAQYQNFFKDYLEVGHMQAAVAPSKYVIPHHAVMKQASSTTKVRAVFNASAIAPGGKSLNSMLLRGPKLQPDLSDIISRFRSFPIVLACDIKQMYRQILLNPTDRKFQHIFWRCDAKSEITEYELNTVTYGLVPSAFHAQRVLKQLVCDEGCKYPMASAAILENTYIDDIVTGANSIAEAVEMKDQLLNLLSAGGFQLRKWATNHPEVLSSLPSDHLETPLLWSDSDQLSLKILGIYWEPRSDSFGYHYSTIGHSFTKRSVLSHIARIFDPLGWLAPVVFWAKSFLQILWQRELTWDGELPPDLSILWNDFVIALPAIKSVKIPRFIDSLSKPLDLIGFCDASQNGYAAVLYVRTRDEQGVVRIHLLKAKTKVAPHKTPTTIPRLELCGAHLLSRLFGSVKTVSTTYQFVNVYLFTDSSIVLAWLRTPPHRLKVFVANRVVSIMEKTPLAHWRHIESALNPADCASRGLSPRDIPDHDIWWTGPSFLQSPVDEWPQSLASQPLLELPELKDFTNTNVLVATETEETICELVGRFSSFSKLIRVTAYVLRFINNVRYKSRVATISVGHLTTFELVQALTTCIKIDQTHHFSEVIKQLSKGFTVRDPIVAKLSVFLDECGTLRVGGRISASDLPYSAKHPWLLSKNSELSKLICDYYHVLCLHAGPRLMQSMIVKRFWILSSRSLIRQRIHKCLKCFKLSAHPVQPVMADLPAVRFSKERAFVNVGVDFGGPFFVKQSKRRNTPKTKGYLCLFICLSTRALHLEFVSELSSSAFLAAFDRFVSRRGLVSHIYSDNGSNFVGAAREMREIFKIAQSEEVLGSLSSRRVEWHFNPPNAPNFGGIWEAGIKSVKHHLKRIVEGHSLTFEEMSTVLCRIEAVVNSRPLYPVSMNPADQADPLTPGHFLTLAPLLQPPEADLTSEPMSHLNRWQLLTSVVQSFWRRWSKEYLHCLIPRSKWTKSQPNVCVGDLVFLQKVNTSPSVWPIGLVIDTYPGNDGVVRVVRIKTAHNELVRPVNKLIVIPR